MIVLSRVAARNETLTSARGRVRPFERKRLERGTLAGNRLGTGEKWVIASRYSSAQRHRGSTAIARFRKIVRDRAVLDGSTRRWRVFLDRMEATGPQMSWSKQSIPSRTPSCLEQQLELRVSLVTYWSSLQVEVLASESSLVAEPMVPPVHKRLVDRGEHHQPTLETSTDNRLGHGMPPAATRVTTPSQRIRITKSEEGRDGAGGFADHDGVNPRWSRSPCLPPYARLSSK